nr:hypothetical protein [Polymorphobacter sp.]
MTVRLLMLCGLLLAPLAVRADEPDIAAQRVRLEQLTTRVDRAAGRPFSTNRRIHVDLDSRVFGTWLAAVAPNGVRSSATGTRFEGVLVQDRVPLIGLLEARLDPASATRLDLTLSNPRVTAATDRLTVTGDLSATARAQARVTAANFNRTATCRTTAPVRERGTASFELGPAARTRYPFTLRLTRPDNLRASLDCDLAELRRIENILPINGLAGQLASGSIDIGLSETLRLPTPGAGRPMTVAIEPRRPNLRITAQGLAYGAD